ncbi:MAG: hypothetical protein EOP84_21490 [Verrucomicrobiaceae bacterium]|nr:MAG: hypothetical protein EOP84_21490 [Verrucomicrobiaceae bacterium]
MPSWNRIKTLDDVPDEIDVKVNYYRESDHSDLMKAFEGSMDKLPAAEGTIIKISKSEFLAYWLFEDKNPDDLISSGFDAFLSKPFQKMLCPT